MNHNSETRAARDQNSATALQDIDDFLDLKRQSFTGHFAIVLSGSSGSGKSTLMRYLREQHPDLRGRRFLRIESAPIVWQHAVKAFEKVDAETVLFVDEVSRIRDVLPLYRFFVRGNAIVVASHLPEYVFWPLALRGRLRLFRCDRATGKLSRYLSRRGIAHTTESLQLFARKFSANYTDLEIILERYPNQDFDSALQCFLRFDDIRKSAH